MWKWLKYLFLAALITSFAPVGLFAFTETWDAAEETVPADLDDARDGASEIRQFKRNIRERQEDEHDFGTITGTDTGVHLKGSARAWVQDAEPASTPGGLTIDEGSVWFETDTEILYVYESATWVPVVDADDHVTLSTTQAVTGTKTFDLAIFKRFQFKSQAVTAATYTVDIDYNLYLCDTTSNAITLDLPTAASIDGEIVAVKLVNATNALTINPNGAETLDDSASLVMSVVNDYIIIASDGTNWRVIAGLVVGTTEAQHLSTDAKNTLTFSVFDKFAGDGSDGDVTQDNGTTSLSATAGYAGTAVVQYDDLTLTNNVGPGILTGAAGVKALYIGVKGTLTIESGAVIAMNSSGAAGGLGQTNDVGLGGTGGRGCSDGLIGVADVGGSAGGIEGNSSGGSGGGGGGGTAAGSNKSGAGAGGNAAGLGGAGGGDGSAGSNGVAAADSVASAIKLMAENGLAMHLLGYGAGGGGGGVDVGGSGGDGGDGGGVVYIEANAVDIEGVSAIRVNGENGENVGGHHGSGAGGGGGTAVLRYRTLTGAGTLTSTGGIGGTETGTGGTGGDGADGLALAVDVDG